VDLFRTSWNCYKEAYLIFVNFGTPRGVDNSTISAFKVHQKGRKFAKNSQNWPKQAKILRFPF